MPQLGIIVQDLPRPGTVRLSGIDHHHVLTRVADEVNLGASGVHRPEGARVLQNVSAVDVFGDLHIIPLWCGRSS